MGADSAEADPWRDRVSLTFGSVVERRNDGGVTSDGVSETRGLAGSVILRRDGARNGGSAGVDEGEECNSEANVVKVLIGLSLVGMLKPGASGETGLAVAIPS